MLAAQTQSFLCDKFSTARLEVLPNLRLAGVFQISTMVDLGIGFQEPSTRRLTRPSVKLDEKMSLSLRLRKITRDTCIQIPACRKVI